MIRENFEHIGYLAIYDSGKRSDFRHFLRIKRWKRLVLISGGVNQISSDVEQENNSIMNN